MAAAADDFIDSKILFFWTSLSKPTYENLIMKSVGTYYIELFDCYIENYCNYFYKIWIWPKVPVSLENLFQKRIWLNGCVNSVFRISLFFLKNAVAITWNLKVVNLFNWKTWRLSRIFHLCLIHAIFHRCLIHAKTDYSRVLIHLLLKRSILKLK